MVTVSRPRCVQHFSGKRYATDRRVEGDTCNLDEQWHPGASGGWHKNRAEQQQSPERRAAGSQSNSALWALSFGMYCFICVLIQRD